MEDLAPTFNSMPIEEDPFVLLPFDIRDEEDEPPTPTKRG